MGSGAKLEGPGGGLAGPALRLALELWSRRFLRLSLGNLAAALAVALPLWPALWALSRLGAGPGRGWATLGFLTFAWTLAWMAFAALCGWSEAADLEEPWPAWKRWWRSQVWERLAAGLLSLLLLACLLGWARLLRHFAEAGRLADWQSLLLSGLLGALALWLGLAALLGMGLAAAAGGPAKALWKAGALLPLAFAPAALAAGALCLLGLGVPALLLPPGHWGLRLLLAPPALAPVFTAGFLAAFLTRLARGMLDRARDRPSAQAPGWGELWRPWR